MKPNPLLPHGRYDLTSALTARQPGRPITLALHNALLEPYGLTNALRRAHQKRKAYFAFYYDDVMRVNNVRRAWKIKHPDAPAMRSFYDSSLWESCKLEGPEAIKRLIRKGVEYTSAVSVLIGSHTWSRRWVRYEIARAVIDGRGLLGVHINGINHIDRGTPDRWGQDPLDYLAVGKVRPNLLVPAQYYLFERAGAGWVRYRDYTFPVKLPPYLIDPAPGYVTQLSSGTGLYDFVGGTGHANVGAWIDHAAQQVGR